MTLRTLEVAGDFAVEPGILDQIHFAHAARADFGDEMR
jgi:hypothetical protein